MSVPDFVTISVLVTEEKDIPVVMNHVLRDVTIDRMTLDLTTPPLLLREIEVLIAQEDGEKRDTLRVLRESTHIIERPQDMIALCLAHAILDHHPLRRTKKVQLRVHFTDSKSSDTNRGNDQRLT